MVNIEDGEILGGCKPTVTECSDNSTQCATNGSSLQGTCIYPSEQVPGGFGSGVCRPGQLRETDKLSAIFHTGR